MYKIETPVWKKESVVSPRPFVHPFYKSMFRKLYGLGEKETEAYIGKDGAVIDSCDFLEPLVKQVWEGHKNCVSQFYDIRTNEETGQTAPEYAILKRVGIRNISPIGIRGMGSMAWLLGLQMMELAANEGDCAIMLLAELEHDFEIQGENIACAFALYPCKNFDNQGGIWITGYQLHLTADEVRTAVKDFKGNIIFSEAELGNIPTTCDYTLCREHGLTVPMLYLYKMLGETKTADVLTVHVSGNQYGLIYYYVLGKG
ncbi:MAG: hypothetical protein HDR28_12320 [Lachnospiraceae bacterium]|nr:hypothetical protein [Lachnospiraceae bacterium]